MRCKLQKREKKTTARGSNRRRQARTDPPSLPRSPRELDPALLLPLDVRLLELERLSVRRRAGRGRAEWCDDVAGREGGEGVRARVGVDAVAGALGAGSCGGDEGVEVVRGGDRARLGEKVSARKRVGATHRVPLLPPRPSPRARRAQASSPTLCFPRLVPHRAPAPRSRGTWRPTCRRAGRAGPGSRGRARAAGAGPSSGLWGRCGVGRWGGLRAGERRVSERAREGGERGDDARGELEGGRRALSRRRRRAFASHRRAPRSLHSVPLGHLLLGREVRHEDRARRRRDERVGRERVDDDVLRDVCRRTGASALCSGRRGLRGAAERRRRKVRGESRRRGSTLRAHREGCRGGRARSPHMLMLRETKRREAARGAEERKRASERSGAGLRTGTSAALGPRPARRRDSGRRSSLARRARAPLTLSQGEERNGTRFTRRCTPCSTPWPARAAAAPSSARLAHPARLRSPPARPRPRWSCAVHRREAASAAAAGSPARLHRRRQGRAAGSPRTGPPRPALPPHRRPCASCAPRAAAARSRGCPTCGRRA